jgi:uncharacterized protein (TIGR02145 family)
MYNDGTPIDLDASGTANGSTAPQTWGTRASGAYTIYANESSTLTNGNASNFGYLYNSYAATDSRKLCPTDWHVPTDDEWTTLETYLNTVAPTGSVGDKMKANNAALWTNNTGTNISGFSALPGGWRNNDGSFNYIRNLAVFWSASEFASFNFLAWGRTLSANDGVVLRATYFRSVGASVRCLRD